MPERRSPFAGIRGAWPALAGLAACLGLIAAFFWKHILTDQILGQGDAFLLFYPAWDFRGAALRAGRLPLWNPITFMGAPFLANSQYGVLYPLNWPVAWLAAPVAFKVSALAHLTLAALGAYLFARRAARMGSLAAWVAGALFALGGYMTARFEQINQLQGLAWLPWAMWAAAEIGRRPRRHVPIAGGVLALQLLAGHTQTIAITLAGALAFVGIRGLAEYRAARPAPGARGRTAAALVAWPTLLLMASAGLAAWLSAAQVLPTLELARESVRGGGLPINEAISFSLDPRLLGQALLPGYSRALYSEYGATIGVTGLCLVVAGLYWGLRRPAAGTSVQIALVGVAVVGLFLALGRYNPAYLALVRFLPGFDLFRVPARWLALWAFGAAILAGYGLQGLLEARLRPQAAAIYWLGVAALAGLAYFAAGITPTGETGPLPPLAGRDVALWLGAAVVTTGLGFARGRPAVRALALAGLAAVELFAASRMQSFNQLTARSAYDAERPTIPFLNAEAQGQAVAGRVLAQSRLFYDPTLGGVPLIDSAAVAGLPAEAAYRYIVAAKYQDVLTHNLALTWGIPTLDGYDGGILPLRNYVLFAEYLLGRPPLTRDGRLRESLDQFPANPPDGRALSLADARYLIADQTFDAWEDDIYFDLTHHARLASGQTAEVAELPDFAGDTLQVVSFLDGASAVPDGTPAAEVTVTFDDGRVETYALRAGHETAEGDYQAEAAAHGAARIFGHYWPDRREVNDYIATFRWPEPRRIRALSVAGRLPEGAAVIRGLTIVNSAGGGFSPLVISSSGRYRLALRADVKVYENLDALPRAFISPEALLIPDDGEALAAMRAAEFNPAHTVVLHDGEPLGGEGAAGTATITAYSAERVVVEASLQRAGVLVLADAWYPGWTASVDGQPAPIHRADLLFRAIRLEAGRHVVVFDYRPASVRLGGWASLAAILVAAGSLAWPRLAGREDQPAGVSDSEGAGEVGVTNP